MYKISLEYGKCLETGKTTKSLEYGWTGRKSITRNCRIQGILSFFLFQDTLHIQGILLFVLFLDTFGLMLAQVPSELSAAGAKCGVRSLPGGSPGPSSFQYWQKKPKAEKPKCLRLCIKRTSLHSFSLFGGRVLPVWKGVGCRWWKITLISGKNWPAAAAADCTRADGWKIKTLVSRSSAATLSRPYFLEKVMEQGCINSAQKWKHGNRRWDAHHS